ncbi:putative COP9 signalosome complex subunit 7a [Hypsibius exemplaris]|uniref:COP9 signalosome complex subunit 7a n=1 Tax=Hypsibius exemplaris TaxID=2072580 RepID=A0A9X6NP83_HYPEX|nr:putative COP9 signalosome complex subunit 7a [Hypsibius exemplaris]
MAAVEAESRLPELEVLLRSKSSKGRMIADLLRQITEIPDIYRFQTYLTIPNVQDLRNSDFTATLDLLALYAYGTYSQYSENSSKYPALSEKQIFTLRCLTLASLAKESDRQKIPFKTIEDALGFTDHWQVFDFIIEALNYSYVKGKLDEPKRLLIVEEFITRDVDVIAEGKHIRSKLELFTAACENTLQKTKEESARIDQQKLRAELQKQELALKIENTRGTIGEDGLLGGLDSMQRQKGESSGKLFKTRAKNSSKSGGLAKIGRM